MQLNFIVLKVLYFLYELGSCALGKVDVMLIFIQFAIFLCHSSA
jgi:hypothetical protein